MYSFEKSLRQEKSRRNHYDHLFSKNPSFSSTLLDEIYRSIDGNDGKNDQEKFYKDTATSAKKQQNGCRTGRADAAGDDEEMGSLKRACLIEKWMEKQVSDDKVSSRSSNQELLLHQEDESLFFSTTSSSSESSNSGGLSSSSDTEFFAAAYAKSSKSCFATIKKPKPVKTSVSPRSKNQSQQQKNEFFMADYRGSTKSSKQTEENLIKSESRAWKIYANLKKVKEPISPGGRLTSFINNIFTSGNSKKNRSTSSEKKSAASQAAAPSSTCSSTSSFSRSCLSKTSPNSRAKFNEGMKRTVRFYPVSVIVDEDSRPCGHKQIQDHWDSDKFVRPTKLSQNPTTDTKNNTIHAAMKKGSQDDQKKDKNFGIFEARMLEEDFDFDDDDDASDCSSDLFEIDHLALFGKSRFREELPVYETTHLDTNRAIASGLIR